MQAAGALSLDGAYLKKTGCPAPKRGNAEISVVVARLGLTVVEHLDTSDARSSAKFAKAPARCEHSAPHFAGPAIESPCRTTARAVFKIEQFLGEKSFPELSVFFGLLQFVSRFNVRGMDRDVFDETSSWSV